MPKTLIIDANYYCNSAKHAMRDLSYEDQETGVLFGFFIHMLKLASHFNTGDFVFCWDSRKSLRKMRYDWYKERNKSERTEEQKMLDEIAFPQFDILREEILPELGFLNNFQQVGYEADDLIASIVQNVEGDFVICTSDEDMFQLLDYADVWLQKRQTLYKKKDLYLDYGVTPKDWVRVKAIGGCRSDTVKGVKGVAEKTACQFLTGKLPAGKKRESIESAAGREIEKRNTWLVKLPLEGTPIIDLVEQPPIKLVRFNTICDKYGFYSFRKPDELKKWIKFFNMK